MTLFKIKMPLQSRIIIIDNRLSGHFKMSNWLIGPWAPVYYALIPSEVLK